MSYNQDLAIEQAIQRFTKKNSIASKIKISLSAWLSKTIYKLQNIWFAWTHSKAMWRANYEEGKKEGFKNGYAAARYSAINSQSQQSQYGQLALQNQIPPHNLQG